MQEDTRYSRYFNAASHGLPEAGVYRRIADCMRSQAELGPEKAAHRWRDQIAEAKDSAARLLNSAAGQVGFTSTTTAAWHSIFSRLDLDGKRVLVTEHEWGDYFRALSLRRGITVEVLPPLDFEAPDLAGWAERIDEDVAVICIPMITSIAGFCYPVEAIGALPRPSGTRLIVDAAQALGQMDVDVARLGCDALISTCRKWLRGPRSTALFWISEAWSSTQDEVSVQSVAPADQNAALIVGLGEAIEVYAGKTPEGTQKRLAQLADRLRKWARSGGIAVFGGPAARSAIVSLEVPAKNMAGLREKMAEGGFSVKMPEISTAEPASPSQDGQRHILRISPHVYTTDEDIDCLTDALEVLRC